MKIETKFNVGDTVWYTKEESVYHNRCDHCGRTDYINPSGVSFEVDSGTVDVINIYVDDMLFETSYIVSGIGEILEDRLFATPEEAEASIEKE